MAAIMKGRVLFMAYRYPPRTTPKALPMFTIDDIMPVPIGFSWFSR